MFQSSDHIYRAVLPIDILPIVIGSAFYILVTSTVNSKIGVKKSRYIFRYTLSLNDLRNKTKLLTDI